MDTERQLMEQLQQLQKENKALEDRNKSLVESYKEVINEAFSQDIKMANFEKDRIKTVNNMIAEIYKAFSGTIHKFSDVVEHSNLDARRQFWTQLQESLSELSNNVSKQSQKHTTRATKDANKRIKDAEKFIKEINKNLEKVNS